jgi:hypothetical protein
VKTIQIDDDIRRFLVSKAVDIGESASRILRRELHIAPPSNVVEIEIDDDVNRFLASKTVEIGESAIAILRRELHLDHEPEHEPEHQPEHQPSIVEFRIPRGTGGGPWNTIEHPVIARVGDTLRLVNDDAVPHRLDTAAGVPFDHPSDSIPPGGSADFVLRLMDPTQGPLHDHNFGPGATFFLIVT